MLTIEGTIAFAELETTEFYNGQDTGKYSVVLSLDDSDATQLADMGVKLREYEGVKQRKFSSKFDVPVYDADGVEFDGRVTRGSKVRIQYKEGNAHPVHGTGTYLEKLKVLELAEYEGSGGDF
jgi:hypothetical protein